MRSITQKTGLALALVAALAPQLTNAHIKWFVETDRLLAGESFRFSLNDTILWVWITIVIGIVLISIILDKKIKPPSTGSRNTIKKWWPGVRWILRITAALWLLYSAYSGWVIASTYPAAGTASTVLQLSQVLIAGLLLTGYFQRVGGALLSALYLAMFIVFPGWDIFEHAFVLGLGIFFLCNTGSKTKDLLSRCHEWTLPTLRVTTGISLIVLGLNEKILHPELSLAFLAEHHWNFMAALGIEWYTDQLFVLSAGMTELLFGTILVLGTITRINTAVMSVFFFVTAIVLGLDELVGHLPIFGIAITLIIYGAGRHFRFNNLLPGRLAK